MKVSTSIWSVWLKVNNYPSYFSIMSRIHFFLFFIYIFFFYSNRVIEISMIIIAWRVSASTRFINHGEIITLTQFFVSVEEIAEPDLHAADRWRGFEMFHDPSVVDYVAWNVPSGSDVLHADVEESCWIETL